jgi:4a-hydroxytetrahydrobiopterin dehydratase
MSVSDALLSLGEIAKSRPSGWEYKVEAKEAKSGEKRDQASAPGELHLLDQTEAIKYGTPKLTATYVFKDFKDCFALMSRVAFEAEAADHHPEWFNVYNRLVISLSTHTSGGVSAKDIALANIIDNTAKGQFGVKPQ